ncbi:Serrate RNA effector molecule [Sesamum alatum]|uniref:Serrate RNA effector molecule n=1 Tax=Sesamum alatum TaxID=300844 RepID=A0AAE1Z3Z8_9LAMI|nr:Serrate RNA effector molecule [Sesamum alatum]
MLAAAEALDPRVCPQTFKVETPRTCDGTDIKVREELYFQKNYMSDENAPGGTPVMQPSFPKEKPLRRRPGLDNRLKDERGNLENVITAQWKMNVLIGLRIPNLGFANNDGASGNNPDEPMFDSFGGQGIPVATFASDDTSSVSDACSWCWPLPEVAMRMLRDQGGPPPLKGQKWEVRSSVSWTFTIIALPPTLRQDPRRLRSYNDLDAPDDEVTVIDYRSL